MKSQSTLFRFVVTTLLLFAAFPALSLDGQGSISSRAVSSSKVGELFCRAMERKNYDMMDTLIAQGADVNAACNMSSRKVLPLFFVIKEGGYAAYQDSRDIYVYLIDHGADVNARTASGATPLIEAAALFANSPRTSVYVMDLLISKGARVTDVDRNDHTSLDYLAGSGYSPSTYDNWKKSIYLLLDNGAKINRQDKAGETVLMRSAKGCGVDAVELMLGSGANPKLANKKGERAYDYALEGALNASRGMMASCNEVVRIMENPQSYMKERKVNPDAATGQAVPAGGSTKTPANVLDALNLFGRVLR